MSAAIIDRGRGPEIAGSRITVYDVLDYSTKGYHHTYIAAVLSLSSDEVLAALRYIEEHRDEVMAEYQQMLERDARGNPPEIRAKQEASRAKRLALQEELRRARDQGGTVRGILADLNLQGHLRVLLFLLQSDTWRDLWTRLNLSVHTFADLGLERNASDAAVWPPEDKTRPEGYRTR